MEREVTGQLVCSEIHGFHTLQDLDVGKMMEEARSRWLRPNEIHAVLCNNRYFSIIVKPVILPKSGTIVLFDRKMLRNFRKDGHNWKKKKDGKTVKEAHEHLKVGNEERIHVYYAHGQDHPTFVRRCYWLLDKSLEHIVLVHYRETQEHHGSPATPTSNSSSVSDPPAPWGLSEEFDSGSPHVSYVESSDPGDNSTVKTLELALHDINTLEWDELLVTNGPNDLTAPGEDVVAYYREHNEMVVNGSTSNGSSFAANNLLAFGSMSQPDSRSDHMNCNVQNPAIETMWDQVSSNMQRRESTAVGIGDSFGSMVNDGLQSHDSFGRWVNYIMVDSPTSADDPLHQSSISSVHDSLSPSAVGDHQSSFPEQIFNITDFSPTCASSRKETKIIVTGYFHEGFQHLAKSNLFCVCGDVYKPAEIVQPGVYRCFLSARSPGLVNLYMSLDGHKPVSQVLSFEYQSPLLHDPVVASDDNSNREEFQLRIRLAHLLFSTSKTLNILSSKVSPSVLNEAKKFALKTSHISESWGCLIKSAKDDKSPFPLGEDNLFELALKNRLQEWLLERVIGGVKGNEFDEQGQGVIHLCAILGYTWAVHLFSWSGLSLDYRDKFGWTALHWAAYSGREKMVAVLLTAGAKPNYVTDPCSKNPGGCTAADLASMRGYQGLAAYVAEKGLVQQLEDMVVAGNATELPQSSANDICNHENANEEDMNLKDTLAAYRTAANAAAHIQSAFREHSLKVQTKAAQNNNTESEAKSIIAALKIQHAYRHFEVKKRMSAAARIQQGFLTWKTRRQFLNMRRQAIKIQAAFRAFHGRRQYRKIIWSVGVVEKAILRWRLKRKGFRDLQIEDEDANEKQGSDTEEDFFRTSRKQAEERVERSVVRVQAMFRSKKAQEEYRRMKLTHNQAKMEYRVEYEGLNNNVGMDV